MLERINRIKNTGIFKNYNFDIIKHGDIQFSKVNIIYGKNGSGKSTFVDVFRSLKEEDSDILKGRKSINGSVEPIVNLKFQNSIYEFNREWNNSNPNIHIFDRNYIADNIYIGNEISTENRRNQFNIIIGKDNIEINSRLVKINDKLRGLNRTIKELEEELRSEIVGRLNLEEFIFLDRNVDIESIDSQLKELYLSKNNYFDSSKISNFSYLKELSLPDFNIEDFINMLETDNYNLCSKTERDIKEYIENKDLNSNWIKSGFEAVVDNRCPFCNQDLDDSNIFDKYKAFYNNNINDYQVIMEDFNTRIEEHFNESSILKYKLILEENSNNINKINSHIPEIPHVEYDMDMIDDRIGSLFSMVTRLMSDKITNPLKLNLSDSDKIILIENYTQLKSSFEELNKDYLKINKLVDEYKDRLSSVNIGQIESKINYYENLKTAQKESIGNKIDKLKEFSDEVNSLNLEKSRCKSRLENINTNKVRNFNKVLNAVLISLKANFSVKYTIPKFYVHGSEAEYNIIINNKKIRSRVTKKNIDKSPNFKNILSESEKNLLALGYFIASLKLDPDLWRKIIIVDDPTNFCDSTNIIGIASEITKLTGDLNQLFILTHDTDFARKIWEFNIYEDVRTYYIDYFDDTANLVTNDIVKLKRE